MTPKTIQPYDWPRSRGRRRHRRASLLYRQPGLGAQGAGPRLLHFARGIVTFKNARDLQETAKIIPDDRILVETDSPFLAPVPHRGQTCEPAFVADTARFVADLRGVPLETLAEQTTDNFFKLFNKAVA